MVTLAEHIDQHATVFSVDERRAITMVAQHWFDENAQAKLNPCPPMEWTDRTVWIGEHQVDDVHLSCEDDPGTLAHTLLCSLRLHSTTCSRLGDLISDWLDVCVGISPSRMDSYANALARS